MAKKKRDEYEGLEIVDICGFHKSTWHDKDAGCDLERAIAAETELSEIYAVIHHVMEAPPSMYAHERGYLKLIGEILELRDHSE